MEARYSEDQVIDGNIKLIRLLGSGGCGEVWLGRDLILEETLAIKLFKEFDLGRFQKYANSEGLEQQKMFKRDAQIQFKLKGLEHIAEFFAAGINPDDNTIYIVQEFVDGPNLREYLQRGQLETGEIIDILMQVSKGLSGAHGEGVIHNDLKLENILISGEGVKLVDFGLSLFGKEDIMSGSLPYSAPEAIERRAEPASDIWSVGVIGYRLLTGQLPFRSSQEDWSQLSTDERREQEEELKQVIREKEPVPIREINPAVPEDLEKILMKCLRKNPSERYQNGSELWKDLDGFANKRVWYVVDKYKDVKAEDEQGMGKLAGELLESLFRNKIDNWDIPQGKYPYVAGLDGKWFLTEKNFWTAGKLVNIYLIGHQVTGDRKYLELAEERIRDFDLEKLPQHAHVISPIFYDAFVTLFELTGKVEYKEKALEAAKLLCGFYREPGFIQVSEDERDVDKVYMFSMEGCLPLLWWASKNSSSEEERERYQRIAVEHAKTTIKHNVRDDGSVCEIIEFENEGVREWNNSGYGDRPHRSRDQAHAIYGFTLAYEHTGDAEFLRVAEKVADYFIRNLPKDFVPFYDFADPNIPNVPKDSAAASIGALALSMLSKIHPVQQKAEDYRITSERIMLSLTRDCLSLDETVQGLLAHGCSNYKESYATNSFLIYGDEAYLKGLELMK